MYSIRVLKPDKLESNLIDAEVATIWIQETVLVSFCTISFYELEMTHYDQYQDCGDYVTFDYLTYSALKRALLLNGNLEMPKL